MMSPEKLSFDLFHAQALLGVVSMKVPFDEKYDVVRQKLFDASMMLLEVVGYLEKIGQ